MITRSQSKQQQPPPQKEEVKHPKANPKDTCKDTSKEDTKAIEVTYDARFFKVQFGGKIKVNPTHLVADLIKCIRVKLFTQSGYCTYDPALIVLKNTATGETVRLVTDDKIAEFTALQIAKSPLMTHTTLFIQF